MSSRWCCQSVWAVILTSSPSELRHSHTYSKRNVEINSLSYFSCSLNLANVLSVLCSCSTNCYIKSHINNKRHNKLFFEKLSFSLFLSFIYSTLIHPVYTIGIVQTNIKILPSFTDKHALSLPLTYMNLTKIFDPQIHITGPVILINVISNVNMFLNVLRVIERF